MKIWQHLFPITVMGRVLEVSCSGYYAWADRQPSKRACEDERLKIAIRAAHTQSRHTYGARRLQPQLAADGFQAGRDRIARLRREMGLRCRQKRKFKATTNSRHDLPVAPNLLEQTFTPQGPNQIWVTDLTYIATDEGWLYLAIVLDLFNREVVGWSLKPRMTADIVTDALTMACFRKRPAVGLMHHSDRGSQYASHVFQDKLKAHGMTCSMSRKGNCWDNAPTESWFNSFKNERVHGIRYATHAEIKAVAFEYIEVFYNRKRQHSTLGYTSPRQFLAAWINRQHQEKLVA